MRRWHLVRDLPYFTAIPVRRFQSASLATRTARTYSEIYLAYPGRFAWIRIQPPIDIMHASYNATAMVEHLHGLVADLTIDLQKPSLALLGRLVSFANCKSADPQHQTSIIEYKLIYRVTELRREIQKTRGHFEVLCGLVEVVPRMSRSLAYY